MVSSILSSSFSRLFRKVPVDIIYLLWAVSFIKGKIFRQINLTFFNAPAILLDATVAKNAPQKQLNGCIVEVCPF
jgi:hypothetical protein